MASKCSLTKIKPPLSLEPDFLKVAGFLLEPIQELVESNESFVIPLRLVDSQGGAMWKPEHRLAAERRGPRYPSDMNDSEWILIAPLIPPARRGGRPRDVNLREVLNAIFYVLATGCQWQALPKDLPPKSTAHHYFMLWDWDGTLECIHEALHVAVREAAGREASPTAAIIDSQTAKAAQKGAPRSTRRAMTRARRSRGASATSSSTRSACCLA
jgi:transposase